MPRFEIDVNPVNHITTDAIGPPGQRVFYIQAWNTDLPHLSTLIIEKIQLQGIIISVENLIIDLEKNNPDLVPAKAEYDQEKMAITPPVDPLFRVGEFKLGYDDQSDLLILAFYEIQLEDSSQDEASYIRFWCTRSQVRSMTHWSLEVINRGRPICPQCGQPMDPEGHFCPKKNGHKH